MSLFMDRAPTGNILFKQNIFLASIDPPKKNDLPGISWIFFTFDFFYFGCWEKSAKVWAQTSVFPLLRVSGYPLAPRGQALPGRQV